MRSSPRHGGPSCTCHSTTSCRPRRAVRPARPGGGGSNPDGSAQVSGPSADVLPVGIVAPRYEPNLIEDHALELYTRSHTARLTWRVVGAATGLVLGGSAALLLPASLPLPARAGAAALAVFRRPLPPSGVGLHARGEPT